MTVVNELPPGLIGDPKGTQLDHWEFPWAEDIHGLIYEFEDGTVREYNDMLERDGKARNIHQVLSLPLRRLHWNIEKTEGPQAAEIAEFVRDVLERPANQDGMSTSMTDVISQMTQSLVVKKTYFEKVFRVRENRVVLDQLGWRPPATCRLLRDRKTGAFRGFEQDLSDIGAVDPVRIKPERAFVYVANRDRDPLRGASDLAVAYWCFKTKQKIRFLWYTFLEGQAIPSMVYWGQDLAAAQENARRLANMRPKSGVIGMTKNGNDEIQLLESNGRGADVFQQTMVWLDQEMSGSVLAGFTDLTSAAGQGRGSYALSADQSEIFMESRNSTALEIASTFNDYLIPDLVRWNYGPNARPPMFKFAPVNKTDIQASLQLLQTMATVPQTPRVPTEFISELVTKTATYLNMDQDKIEAAIERREKELLEQAETEQQQALAPPVAAADVAAQEVQKAQAQERNGQKEPAR